MSFRPSILRLVACIVIVSMLAVATAPAWHAYAHAHVPTAASDGGCGHGDCGGESAEGASDGDDSSASMPGQDERRTPSKHDDGRCTVCVVMNAPVGGSPPSPAVERVAILIVAMVAVPPSDAPAIGSGPVLFACGPPRVNG
ncbi:MAG: hypothetical protein K2X32_03215 [Phycisphaerales bacterium]|nr:hypothetical protein [Phycisphaerales bacterium]